MTTRRVFKLMAGSERGNPDEIIVCQHSRQRLALRFIYQGLVSLGLLFIAALSGCVADGSYEAGGDTGTYLGYGVDYYDAPGYVYGEGWRPGYRVGPPPRRGWGHGDPHEGRPEPGRRPDRRGGPGFRAAPSSRPMPSIPTAPRGGGRQGGRGGHSR